MKADSYSVNKCQKPCVSFQVGRSVLRRALTCSDVRFTTLVRDDATAAEVYLNRRCPFCSSLTTFTLGLCLVQLCSSQSMPEYEIRARVLLTSRAKN
jgi:hypothetical protein